MQKSIIILLLVISSFKVQASILSGVITDDKKNPLSFASVYIKGTTNGVTANADGKYSLQLEPGSYKIIFAYVGYEKKEESVTIDNNPVTLNVVMKLENVSLSGVTVYSNAEDPAYRIIRAAMKRRKSYLEQVNAYSCHVYIKGVEILDSFPKHILGIKTSSLGIDSSLLGINYLSESESDYNYKHPDKVREIMVSSKVSGQNNAFSYNQASDFDFNFYRNLLNAGDLSDRGFVSPISENAMLYYKYRLIGTFNEDGEIVNKIEVIPKRQHDPVFRGYIYIVEGSWRIHSVDVYLTKDANIDFVDSLELKQTYNKVADTIWMPFNQTFLFRFGALGLKGHGRFIGVFTNYNIHPDFPKHFFKGEEWKVNDDANKKDSIYWNTNRPIPLTREEIIDYRKKDSLERIHNTKPYLDSMDRKRNKFNASKLFKGYEYYRRFNKTDYSISGLLQFINYNTVEGWAPSITLQYSKEWEDRRQISASGNFSYGISDHIFSSTGSVYYLSNPVKLTGWGLWGGRDVTQFNPGAISAFLNTIYTLLFKQNYMKLYDKTFVGGSYTTEITNGIMFYGSASYSLNSPLENTSYTTLLRNEGNTFTSNYPFTGSDQPNFSAYKSFVVNVGATFHIKQRYYTRPHQKIIIGSKYPSFTLFYKKGIDALGSTVNFDYIQAGISDHIKLGLLGQSQYSFSGGKFLNNKSVGIADLKYFYGNQTIFAPENRMNSFGLLPYYLYSTNRYYFQGHFEHHFEGFIMNKIPLLRKLKLHEVVGIHYLYTPQTNYAELQLGFEHILEILRVDFVTSYSSTLKLKNRDSHYT